LQARETGGPRCRRLGGAGYGPRGVQDRVRHYYSGLSFKFRGVHSRVRYDGGFCHRARTGGYGGSSPRGTSVLVDDDAADVLTIHKILVALVNFVQGVLLSNEFGELDVAFVPQTQDHRDVVQRICAAEQRALHFPVVADKNAAGQRHLVVTDTGDDDRARLARHVDGSLDHLVVHLADGADHLVRELPPGEVDEHFLGLDRVTE